MMLCSSSGVELLYRGGAEPESSQSTWEFLDFLGCHAALGKMLSSPARGMHKSPFSYCEEFPTKGEISRKAEEVRAYLRLGIGPVPEIGALCEKLGITLYRTFLGNDLRKFPSGAFLPHPKVGFSILVNLNMTPGRRRFTMAHELAHALFHSHYGRKVVSQRDNTLESFADEFAGDFLMPEEGVRQFMKNEGMGPRIREPAEVIRIQRYFQVSWMAACVHLARLDIISEQDSQRLRYEVRPVVLANSLGYEIDPEEWERSPEYWTVRRFPRLFLSRVGKVVRDGVMPISTAASFSGLPIDVIKSLRDAGTKNYAIYHLAKFEEYESSEVISLAPDA